MIAMYKHQNVYIIADAHPEIWPDSFVRYIDSYDAQVMVSQISGADL